MDNRRAILIGSCIEAAATLVAAGKIGDKNSPDYPIDAVATATRKLLKTASTLALVLFAIPITTTDAHSKSLKTTVGHRVFVTYVRSPCTGGAAPSVKWLNQRLTTKLEHGVMEVGNSLKRKSKSCAGKILWMRKMYYRGKSKGTDVISIKWPDAGLINWTVNIKACRG
jgi:hypothetical protein